MYDLIVVGGGTAGVAAAVTAGRKGLKTLVIEQNNCLGGTQTAGLVTPMMKNLEFNDNCDFYKEILTKLEKGGGARTFPDGNHGWFNPEILKCLYDELCTESNVDILYNSIFIDAKVSNRNINSIDIINSGIKKCFESKYFIDATGDANLAFKAGVETVEGNNGINQPMTLRFNMSNINMKEFSDFLSKLDNTPVTAIDASNPEEVMLSTAYTWDKKDWKLAPCFEYGLKEGLLKEVDTSYFQVFTIPKMANTLGFNCPRIINNNNLNPLDPIDKSKALIIAKEQITRIANFCIKTFPGFENANISQIASMLGVRESRRIVGKYVLTKEDVMYCRKFDNAVAKSNYPIDVHSASKDKAQLEFLKENDYYEIPLECLLTKNIDNLLVIGRCISAEFEAQASLRIQPNCISTGEYAAKYLSDIVFKS